MTLAAPSFAPPTFASGLYEGVVTHTRFKPKTHKLNYRIVMMLFDLDELPGLDKALRLFSLRRFNLMGFHARGHGDGSATPLRQQVERTLRDGGFETGGPIRLLCMPSVLGAVFNPLSVYFCHGANGALNAILYEVNNTFGQRHSYLMPVRAGGGPVRHDTPKAFYVSPFNDLGLTYRFRIVPPEGMSDGDPAAVVIDVDDPTGPLLHAAFAGKREALSDAAIFRAWLRHPLLIAKVVGGIHWEALKLWLKGVKLTQRPPAPDRPVTVGHAPPPNKAARVG